MLGYNKREKQYILWNKKASSHFFGILLLDSTIHCRQEKCLNKRDLQIEYMTHL